MKVPQQPEVNVGMVGHVDHGKTTLTKALTGEWTDKHSEEIKRGISIKLGYADCAIYQDTALPEPECYSTADVNPTSGTTAKLLRTISIVDVPGHETLMAIMLSGTALMHGALLLIAANERCPQPQTREHLMALEIMGMPNLIIVQNKVDLVDDAKAQANAEEIRAFVTGTCAEKAPIIPVSAHHDANIDALIAAIQRQIPTPTLDASRPVRMVVARSFDVNKPGSKIQELVGGVLGGSIMQGVLKEGAEIEISPGVKGPSGWEGQFTTANSLITGSTRATSVHPGGLVGVATDLDPALTKGDAMLGKLVGLPGSLPPVRESVTLDITLLERVVGTAEDLKVEAVRTNEPVMLNVGAATTVGTARSVRDSVVELTLKIPLCVDSGARVAVSRRLGGRFRLIGYGVVS